MVSSKADRVANSVVDSVPNGDGPQPAELVPRLTDQGYAHADVARRRRWVEQITGTSLEHVGRASVDTEEMRGNIENPVGCAQVPLGVAGPLRVEGEYARGTYYVPLATTEGALVRSYERGMVTLTRSGGVTTRVMCDENLVAPVFLFADVVAACDFARRLPDEFPALRAEAETTTRHGKLLRIECLPLGREVIVRFVFATGDAHGMNMIVKATNHACQWITARFPGTRYYIFSGNSSEKRASGALFAGGKGRKVIAGALAPRSLVRAYLHSTPEGLCDVWHRTILGQTHAHAAGYSAHVANGLAAIYIACGQDVANVANAAVGITNFDLTESGDLYASVTLPSLTLGTVGGGTQKGTARECLAMLDCAGTGTALRFAEIVAATLLAGEISMAAAIASGEFVAAHERYGRSRPPGSGPV
jgi:hydroxymethylglutaryl-CoA reductase (NADPH)